MTPVSKNAFAIMGVCEETKEPFGITVDPISERKYKFIWAFKINKKTAKHEGYDQKTVTGSIVLDDEYPGCPYCGEKNFYLCACGKIVCYHGKKVVNCPECGFHGELTKVKEVEIKGGGY